MSEHQRRSPYEPEKSDGSHRHSRQDPDDHEGLTADEEPAPTPAVETLPDDDESAVVDGDT